MSESSTLSVPAGFPAEALTLLVAKGHLKGSLTPDDVIAVLGKERTIRRLQTALEYIWQLDSTS